MQIKWTFCFGNDSNICANVTDQEEDERLSNIINDPNQRWLYVPALTHTAYINLERCTAIIRTEIPDEQPQVEESA